MNRYAGKPFLRLLECYVLNAIDQLDDTQRATLSQMEPKLAAVCNMEGSWLEIVISQMDLPETLPKQVMNFWLQYLDQAKSQGISVEPNEFAMSFVDQNFPDV